MHARGRRTTARAVAFGCLAVAGVAGVPASSSAAGSVSADRLEATVRAQFAERGVVLRRVSCRSARPEGGARISCTALNDASTKLVLRGRVTSVSGGRARFRVKAVYGIARGTFVAAEVRRILERRVGTPARGVTCPRRVRIPTRRAVTCALTTREGTVFDVRVTICASERIVARVATQPR
jgi:hypothetical protein